AETDSPPTRGGCDVDSWREDSGTRPPPRRRHTQSHASQAAADCPDPEDEARRGSRNRRSIGSLLRSRGRGHSESARAADLAERAVQSEEDRTYPAGIQSEVPV